MRGWLRGRATRVGKGEKAEVYCFTLRYSAPSDREQGVVDSPAPTQGASGGAEVPAHPISARALCADTCDVFRTFLPESQRLKKARLVVLWSQRSLSGPTGRCMRQDPHFFRPMHARSGAGAIDVVSRRATGLPGCSSPHVVAGADPLDHAVRLADLWEREYDERRDAAAPSQGLVRQKLCPMPGLCLPDCPSA